MPFLAGEKNRNDNFGSLQTRPFRQTSLSQVSTRYYRFSDVKSCWGCRSFRGQCDGEGQDTKTRKRETYLERDGEIGRQHQQQEHRSLFFNGSQSSNRIKGSSWGHALSWYFKSSPLALLCTNTHTHTPYNLRRIVVCVCVDGCCCTASKIKSQRRKGRGSELEHYHHILHPLVSNCCFVHFFFFLLPCLSTLALILSSLFSLVPSPSQSIIPPLWTKGTRKDDWEETGAKKSNGSVDCLIVHWEKKSVCCLRSHQQQQQKPKDKSPPKKKRKKKFIWLLAFFSSCCCFLLSFGPFSFFFSFLEKKNQRDALRQQEVGENGLNRIRIRSADDELRRKEKDFSEKVSRGRWNSGINLMKPTK